MGLNKIETLGHGAFDCEVQVFSMSVYKDDVVGLTYHESEGNCYKSRSLEYFIVCEDCFS